MGVYIQATPKGLLKLAVRFKSQRAPCEKWPSTWPEQKRTCSGCLANGNYYHRWENWVSSTRKSPRPTPSTQQGFRKHLLSIAVTENFPKVHNYVFSSI